MHKFDALNLVQVNLVNPNAAAAAQARRRKNIPGNPNIYRIDDTSLPVPETQGQEQFLNFKVSKSTLKALKFAINRDGAKADSAPGIYDPGEVDDIHQAMELLRVAYDLFT